jgi:hypothetical protein
MNLHPSVRLDPIQLRRRETAAARIAKMRDTLNTLEHYIENADAETLRGNWWAEVLQDCELALTRALHVTTHDGHSRIGWDDRVSH